MLDITQHRYFEPFESLKPLSYREEVQERLGWVLMLTVTSIDYPCPYAVCQVMGCPALAMAKDDDIRLHGIQRLRHVE